MFKNNFIAFEEISDIIELWRKVTNSIYLKVSNVVWICWSKGGEMEGHQLYTRRTSEKILLTWADWFVNNVLSGVFRPK